MFPNQENKKRFIYCLVQHNRRLKEFKGQSCYDLSFIICASRFACIIALLFSCLPTALFLTNVHVTIVNEIDAIQMTKYLHY
jgi:hypothetical protein